MTRCLSLLPDAAAVLGAGCVVAGVWWMHPPSGLVLLGVALLAGGVLGAKLWAS